MSSSSPFQFHNQNDYVGSTVLIADSNFSLVKLWHDRLGHPSHDVTKSVMRSCSVPMSNNNNFICTACQLGKSKCLPFSLSSTAYDEPLHLISIDL